MLLCENDRDTSINMADSCHLGVGIVFFFFVFFFVVVVVVVVATTSLIFLAIKCFFEV